MLPFAAAKGLTPSSPAIVAGAVVLYILYCALAYFVTFELCANRLKPLLFTGAAGDVVVAVVKLGYVLVGVPTVYRHITSAEEGPDHAPRLDTALVLLAPWGLLLGAAYVASLPLQSLHSLFVRPPSATIDDVSKVEYRVMTECKVCLEYFSDEKLAKYCDECTTPCCIDCFNSYVENKITANEALGCPGCRLPLAPRVWTDVLTPTTRLNCADARLAQDRRQRCPRCDACVTKPSKLRRRRVHCAACQATFCVDCGKTYHLLPTCRDKAFERFARTDDVKRCPGCCRFVQKEPGSCDRVTCIKCCHSFDWSTILSFEATRP
ncbi:hypothetical protein ACHHYP_16522 [Achlya hypogyna]|uniref:RING-type domain-containing protein n=1 Tax=Achlya hypogyna TaxID=1202772 RepID=A0A1V9Y6C2_ACHHY|nr:hypothetical protein ACHHYP_16522 [Achlya hypogyna]